MALNEALDAFNDDVLQGATEEELDTGLRREAKELGLACENDDTSRYSESLDSRISISTGLTSAASIWSEARPQSISSRLSSSSKAHKSPFRRIKELGMLRRYRSREIRCPHCDAPGQYNLACGHQWCAQGLRNITIDGGKCCDTTVPEELVGQVLNPKDFGLTRRPSRIDSLAPKKHEILHDQHEAERRRFDAWLAKTKSMIQAQRDAMIKILEEHHEQALEAQAEDHAESMSVAEDQQVKAEADLRVLQQQEIRDNATALRHMEAYCAGTLASGELHNRVISEQDLNELRKTRCMRDGLDAKHVNAINILRGEQTRRMRLRAQRYEKETQQLRLKQQKEISAIVQQSKIEEALLLEENNKRRQKAHARWKLETMIYMKKLDTENIPESSLVAVIARDDPR